MRKSIFLNSFIIACIGIFGQSTLINQVYGIPAQKCTAGPRLMGTYANDVPSELLNRLIGTSGDVFKIGDEYLYCDDDGHAAAKDRDDAADSSCESGTLVYYYNNNVPYYIKCIAPNNGQDYWTAPSEITTICSNSPFMDKNTPNTVTVLNTNEDKTSTIKKNNGIAKITSHGYNYCLWITCKDGYFINNGQCQSNSNCTKGGGTVQDGKCTCQDKKYEWNGTKCVKTAAAQQADANAAAAQNRSNKQKCEASGGTWTGNACTCATENNLQAKPGAKYECICRSGYDFNSATKKCEMTDVERKRTLCAREQNAKWDDLLNECTCSTPHSKFNYSTARCEQDTYYAACQKIPGAQWSETSNKCVCKDPQRFEPDYDKMACVKTAEAQAAEAALRIVQEQKQSRNAIKEASEGINSIKLKKTVWKNEDGKFNTARLASDSIAAVVLGTTGALITSNVVKKNQVKNGFEDINCAVGGQIVAGWGDQFRVGIR